MRAGRPADLEPRFRVFSNARAMRYWSTLPHASIDAPRDLHARLCLPGPRLYFVIEFEGSAVGTCGISDRNEIGYILHPDHWRRGLMSEAVRAVKRPVSSRLVRRRPERAAPSAWPPESTRRRGP
ncbi:MAG: GNAT family N-acetyltransferase [Rhodobacter sp.]|nr:GNAT family N-acetyltransferase [Rhodobacter sp.]